MKRDAKDIQEAVTGKDLITGKKLTKSEQALTAACAVVPVLSGASVRVTKEGIKARAKVGGKSVRKAVFKSDKASDVGKALKEKAATKLKNAVNTMKQELLDKKLDPYKKQKEAMVLKYYRLVYSEADTIDNFIMINEYDLKGFDYRKLWRGQIIDNWPDNIKLFYEKKESYLIIVRMYFLG